MATPPVSEEELARTVEATRQFGSISKASRELNIPESTLRSRLRKAGFYSTSDGRTIAERIGKSERVDELKLPELPDDDIPIDEVIDGLSKRFQRRYTHASAKRWIDIQLPDDRPFGVLWVGDPHVDDNGCNWPLLRQHCQIASAEGVYACSVGDITNNWVGRLTRLWAEQDTSKQTAQRLARWLLLDSGLRWLVWTLGNHDLWSGSELLKEFSRQAPYRMLVEDWGCQYALTTPNGSRFKVFQSHNFPGTSMWNPGHGGQRAAYTGPEANLYVCGDLHTWVLHHEENAKRDFVYWFVRCRGYKYLDSYAVRLGHEPQKEGASILSVFNPGSKTMAGAIQCFADVEAGLEYLAWLRARSV